MINNRISRLILIIIFVQISISSFSNITYTDTSLATENNLEWSVTLNFIEPGGTNNFVVFGEGTEATDEKDNYDVPIPPSGISPYIRPWFDSGLEEPYNSLIYDIKNYPDESKIWDLYIQWVPTDYSSSNDITISWDLIEITASGYETVVLFDYENGIVVADMQDDSEYIYEFSAMVQYHFQIICNSSQSNNPPYIPSNPNPENKATEVYADITLSWTGGDPDIGDKVKYDVYFGTNPSPPQVSSNQSTITYKPDAMNYDTKYFWKIVIWDEHGLSKESSIWDFTTGFKLSPPENILPIAIIKSPQKGYVNHDIIFDASDSYDSDGYIKYYIWDFSNDGKWDTDWLEETVITNFYKISGNYSIKLQVKDNGGKKASIIKKISILPFDEGKIVPIADSNGPYTGMVNRSITFDSTGSYDSDGTISNYSWDFGEGIKKYAKVTNHIFQTNGTYSISLTVVDNDGLIDVDETFVYIYTNDSDEDGWGDEEELKYGSDPNNSEDFPIDTDNDHIPDEIDENDDNDGLSDTLEEKLGSDPKNDSDVLGIEINKVKHFLVDNDKDGKSEIFYNSRTGNTTEIYYKDEFLYLLDEDGDGKWDYIYDFSLGTISPYKKEGSSIFHLEQIIMIGLVCFLIIIFLIWFLKKRV